MYKKIVVIFFLLAYHVCSSQSDSIQARIILIGDAGELNFGREPVVDAARDLIPLDKKTTVIYLGDNIYDVGLPDDNTPGYEAARSVLDSQINIAKGTDAQVVFTPGNHDWNNQSADGLDKIKRQADYINSQWKNIHFYPTDGCPGPAEFSINDNIELVVFDSQWFIRTPSQKPGIESDCPYKTPEEFYAELNDVLNRNSKKLVILACHHTLRSYGIHGGYFPLKTFIFPLTDVKPNLWVPLPVIGAVYPIARGVFGTPEDLHYPAYANMRIEIDRIVREHSNVIFVAGHEHTLQLIKDSSFYYITSGAGSKSTRVSKGKKTVYKAQSLGFANLEISTNKNVHVDFYTVNKDSASHSFSKNLFNFSSLKNELSDSTTTPEAVPVASFKDSVTVAINPQYQKVSSIHKFIAGKNYRKEWATPVHLKVFNLNKENGGYKILNLSGGGRKDASLILQDQLGQNWVLQTVDKVPSGSSAEALKAFVPQPILQDLVSAEYPFGALIIPKLADAASTVHSDPTYYFVPDDPAFGFYRKAFANKICLLEILDPTSGEAKILSSAKVVDKVISDSKNHIDQQAILRARLLDMMVGDWDRHFDQWKFGVNDTGQGKLYYPIPRGRDAAFYYSGGLFIKGVTVAALPYLQGFRKHYPSIKWFNWEERFFDRAFMNNLDEHTWSSIIKKFQEDENDTVISEALRDLPKEIYASDQKKIFTKLKSRRDLLSKDGMKYYRFLSKKVDIIGSNKNEYFKLFNKEDSLEVTVYKKKKKNSDTSDVMFDRVFDSKITKYINLYGLNGNDIFEIDSTANSKIKVRIIGGKGRDTFNINGKVRNTIYDFKPDSNFLQGSRNTKNKISTDANANLYDITAFNYNVYRLPLVSVAYNDEDKTLAGLGYSLKTYDFRKDPYSTYQRITSLYSFATSKFQVHYDGEFNELLGKYDLVGNGNIYNSVLNNYFGQGNETKIDKAKSHSFYNVRYNYLSADLLLRKRFHHLAEFNFGPSYYHYWNHYYDNKNSILSSPGLDSADVYTTKTYAGGKASIIIHNINSDLLPTRGIYWKTEFSSLFGTTHNTRNITKITSDMTVYSSFNDPTNFIIVSHFGWGHIFSENYEYFQALDLGQNNYLRGFRKNRFTGKSLLYQSTEFRFKLFESKSYIAPGTVGIIAFNDVGKVWVQNETSRKWHDAYGGGLYYSPYNFAIVSATIAFSNEERLLNISIGTKFNITY